MSTTGRIVRQHALLPFCASLSKHLSHIVDCTVAWTCKKLLFIVNNLQKMVCRWTTDAWHGTSPFTVSSQCCVNRHGETCTKCKLTKGVILMKLLYNLAENNCLN